MPNITNSGIRTAADGSSYIPASQRPDGTTRKEIRVRPGFTPQEDVKTYKSRNAEAWKNRGSGGVPGAEDLKYSIDTLEPRSKNARRREAAKKKQAESSNNNEENDLVDDMSKADLSAAQVTEPVASNPEGITTNGNDTTDAERQKKIRNLLKKVGAIKDLKEKKEVGEKLSPDQLMKLGREQELLRDLKKLGYEDIQLCESVEQNNIDVG